MEMTEMHISVTVFKNKLKVASPCCILDIILGSGMSACSQMCSVNTSVCAKPWCMLSLCSRVNMLSIFIPSWPATHADQEIVQNPAAMVIVRHREQDHITPDLRELHWLQVHDSILCKLLSVIYSVQENLPLNLSVVILLHTHLIHPDHKASHFLMFWGPSTVKQSDMASKPSDISPLPKAMPCPGDRVKRNLLFFSPLSIHTSSLQLFPSLCVSSCMNMWACMCLHTCVILCACFLL